MASYSGAAAAAAHDGHKHVHEHPVTSVGTYFLVYLFLLAGLAITYAVAFLDLGYGPINNAVAMTIAVAKAMAVILYFMGVRFNTRVTWLWVGAGFLWLLILIATVGDYMTRHWVRAVGWQ